MKYVKLFDAFQASKEFFNDKINWKVVRFIQDSITQYQDEGIRFDCVILLANDYEGDGHNYELLYDITVDKYYQYASEVSDNFIKYYNTYFNDKPYLKIQYQVWITTIGTDSTISRDKIKEYLEKVKNRIRTQFKIEVRDFSNGFGFFLLNS